VTSSVSLITNRYFLRTLGPNDATESYVAWMNDPDVNRTLNPKPKQTVDSIKDYILSHDNQNSFLFGIFTKKQHHIGNISFRSQPEHKMAIMGIMIGDKAHWGAAAALEARSAVLDWAFDFLGLNKVEAGCHHTNAPAVYNFRRQGWTLEGNKRSHLIVAGRPIDELHFAMFKEDWYARRK